jgi:hypothetical protein
MNLGTLARTRPQPSLSNTGKVGLVDLILRERCS